MDLTFVCRDRSTVVCSMMAIFGDRSFEQTMDGDAENTYVLYQASRYKIVSQDPHFCRSCTCIHMLFRGIHSFARGIFLSLVHGDSLR
jgi:hypothetical protein